jgi:hypothetical protein
VRIRPSTPPSQRSNHGDGRSGVSMTPSQIIRKWNDGVQPPRECAAASLSESGSQPVSTVAFGFDLQSSSMATLTRCLQRWLSEQSGSVRLSNARATNEDRLPWATLQQGQIARPHGSPISPRAQERHVMPQARPRPPQRPQPPSRGEPPSSSGALSARPTREHVSLYYRSEDHFPAHSRIRVLRSRKPAGKVMSQNAVLREVMLVQYGYDIQDIFREA